MTTLQLVIVCATTIVLVGMLAAIAMQPKSSSCADCADDKLAADATIVVHTLDQRALRGTVHSATASDVTLHDAAYLTDGQVTPLGGSVVVPTRVIAFTQVL